MTRQDHVTISELGNPNCARPIAPIAVYRQSMYGRLESDSLAIWVLRMTESRIDAASILQKDAGIILALRLGNGLRDAQSKAGRGQPHQPTWSIGCQGKTREFSSALTSGYPYCMNVAGVRFQPLLKPPAIGRPVLVIPNLMLRPL